MGRPVLHRLGRGASASLGPMAEATADEDLVGFVAIGRSDAQAKPMQRRPAHEVLREWPYTNQAEKPGLKTKT